MLQRRISAIIHAVLIAWIIIMTIILSSTGGTPSRAERALSQGQDFSAGWKTPDGTELKNIRRLETGDGGHIISNTLPDIPEGSSLCFRAAHFYYEILIDGEPIYKQTLPADNSMYTSSDGAVWAWVPLKAEYSGRTVSIKYTPCYPHEVAVINDIRICPAEGFILDKLTQNLPAIMTAFIYAVLAVILIVADIPINFGRTKNHEILYLGLLSLSIGAYVFCESQGVQLFTGNEKIMHMLSCITLMLIPIPTVLYAGEAFGFANKYVPLLYSGSVAAVFAVLFILNFAGISDYHENMLAIHITNIAALLLMSVAIVRHYKAMRRGAKKSRRSVSRIVGLSALAIASLIDVIRFYVSKSPDRAAYLRIGILIFIICFGISSLSKTIQAVRAGAKAEIIRSLAYTDGLTGLGNRTAFNEKTDELRAAGAPAGVVMLDVNNLKTVNDGLGHEMGDKLLKKSSEFISTAFEGALCYRTGGDEFVVIIEAEDSEKRYQDGAQTLLELCRGHNSADGRSFDINIAAGFCRTSPEMPIDDACKEADALMYKNKRIMKAAARGTADTAV